MGRNYLAHTQGDAINAILAAAGYNFSLLLKAEGVFVALDRRVPEPAEAACRLAVKIVHGRPSHFNIALRKLA
ncbi:hypothetical protein GCM10010869_53540 [Mesorhizobium tianshanense]|nr:hypothetical protein GCM10010869_53540 [Mesorhizobium tianshanense]